MKMEVAIDVVKMSECDSHCFHKECLESQLGSKGFLKCSICSQVSGILTGEMPSGEMNWRLIPFGRACQGYEDFGTWEIKYKIGNGKNRKTGV